MPDVSDPVDKAAVERVPATDREAVEAFKARLRGHMMRTVGKGEITATDRDWYNATAHTVRDLIVEVWMDSNREAYDQDAKRVYYLSLEFLIGRSLTKNLLNTGAYELAATALEELGHPLHRIAQQEPEAALGNGGLGRLAACFMDSMATVGIPGYGYGIRYHFGMFAQLIDGEGQQVEMPENWLRFGDVWEFARPELQFPVKFFGQVVEFKDDQGRLRRLWTDTEEVLAQAYDLPTAGFNRRTVNNLRLWVARSSQVFDLKQFSRGDYIEAVRHQSESESLTRVLYPDDSTFLGRLLRLKQEYFFVSASLQDILRRFFSAHEDLSQFPDKVAIQLNDTHPAIGVAELMRLLVDVYLLDWDKAWDITVRTFSYTNHTLLPEALESWPLHMFESMLPRHLEIIYEINHRFLQEVRRRHPGDHDLARRLSMIGENGERQVRMSHLAFVGSHRVNGVSAVHTELMKAGIFADMHEMFPDRIVNMTNGITPRRWLNQCNPDLAGLIRARIGGDWVTDLGALRDLEGLADDAGFQADYAAVKQTNKIRLAEHIRATLGLTVDPQSMFDVQIKRIHEYKRQLLNLLHVIGHYNRLRTDPHVEMAPRTVIFAGKAAPGYHVARQIVRLINAVADVVNHDPAIGDRLKVAFLPNYNVSLAELVIPAADLSQQISTAGTEASGTGNMKLALNGALTIGTRDGANIEIAEEVGEENIFFFGLSADEANRLRFQGPYDPWVYYHGDPGLRLVLDMISGGYFHAHEPYCFAPIFDLLTAHGDRYLLLADYADYVACQERVDRTFRDRSDWLGKAILNTARMGKFSSDRTVLDYARDIWGVSPIRPSTAG